MNIDRNLFHDFSEIAIKRFPNEACAVIYNNKVIELDNVATTPESAFQFDPLTYLNYVDCSAILHSHTKKSNRLYKLDIRTPSITDRLKCLESKKPWGIIGTDGVSVTELLWLPRLPSSNYLGRPFIWFINDCYTLVQDYYKFEFNINLIDHALDFDPQKSHKLLDRVFENYIDKAGFTQFDTIIELKKGDLLLLNHLGVEQSHLGIYTGSSVLHQDSLSVEIPIETVYAKITRILRHRELL